MAAWRSETKHWRRPPKSRKNSLPQGIEKFDNMKRLIVYRTTHCEISVCDQYGVHKEKRATHLNVHECDRTIFFFSLLLKKKRNIRSREAYRTWGNKQSSFFAIVSLFQKKKSPRYDFLFAPFRFQFVIKPCLSLFFQGRKVRICSLSFVLWRSDLFLFCKRWWRDCTRIQNGGSEIPHGHGKQTHMYSHHIHTKEGIDFEIRCREK